MGHSHRTLALKASQSCVYKESQLDERSLSLSLREETQRADWSEQREKRAEKENEKRTKEENDGREEEEEREENTLTPSPRAKPSQAKPHNNTPQHTKHKTHTRTTHDTTHTHTHTHMNAWICAQSTTDRDLETIKVNAWICAPTQHRSCSCTRYSCGHYCFWN